MVEIMKLYYQESHYLKPLDTRDRSVLLTRLASAERETDRQRARKSTHNLGDDETKHSILLGNPFDRKLSTRRSIPEPKRAVSFRPPECLPACLLACLPD